MPSRMVTLLSARLAVADMTRTALLPLMMCPLPLIVRLSVTFKVALSVVVSPIGKMIVSSPNPASQSLS